MLFFCILSERKFMNCNFSFCQNERSGFVRKKYLTTRFRFRFRFRFCFCFEKKFKASARTNVWHHRKTWKRKKEKRKERKRKRKRKEKERKKEKRWKSSRQKKMRKPKQNVWALDMDEEEYLGWTSKTFSILCFPHSSVLLSATLLSMHKQHLVFIQSIHASLFFYSTPNILSHFYVSFHFFNSFLPSKCRGVFEKMRESESHVHLDMEEAAARN